MRPNPANNSSEIGTDTEPEKKPVIGDCAKPVLLMAHSPIDSEGIVGRCEDRWEITGDSTVGRKASSDISLHESWLSKTHFRIFKKHGNFFIEDLNSTNGTFINGVLLSPKVKHRLKDATLIRAGRTLFIFHEEGSVFLDPVPHDTCDMAGRFHVAPLLKRLKKTAYAYRHVLLSGPTGSGKESAAHALAKFSDRKLITYNAARFGTEDEALLSLFGAARGIFTGVDERIGLIESADRKMLFLDKAHLLPRRIQQSLLRVLEDGMVVRIGETQARRVDVRFILASNDPSPSYGIEHDIPARLHVVKVPSLRERIADIPGIFRYLMESMLRSIDVDLNLVMGRVTADYYESLCLDGFPADNTRGLIEIAYDIVIRIRDGMPAEQAVKSVFESRYKRGPVFARNLGNLYGRSPPERAFKSTPDLKRQMETGLDTAMKRTNLNLATLNLIAALYYEHKGKVSNIKANLEKAHGACLSRKRIYEVLDLLNLPRLKRPRLL